MQRTAEVMDLAEAGALVPVAALPDLVGALAELQGGTALGLEQLWETAEVLRAAAQLRRFLDSNEAKTPALRRFLRLSAELDPLEVELSRGLATRSELRDEASSQLAELRKQGRATHAELKETLQAVMARQSEGLQGSYLVERDGRYVIPWRADAPFRIEGLVLGSSSSGSTLYVEPTETRALGNRLQQLRARAAREEARLLGRYNEIVRRHADDIRQAFESCVELDCLQALARFAAHCDARPFIPSPTARIRLRAVRHPLLVLAATHPVVENDLFLEAGRALVLSGPNAGGKTVALKCLGLCALMGRAGVPIPAAAGSEIGWFETIVAEIGDHQSLLHSLSTFGAHLRALLGCLRVAAEGTLVLVDEPCGGTDPSEGSALACAILERLVARGSAVCVTTHYDAVKRLAAQHPGMTNAALGFDAQNLAPTYRITLGAPGASSPLAIARHVGVEPTLIERAEQLLSAEEVTGRALLEELRLQHARADELRRQCEDEHREIKRKRFELEAEQRKALGEQKARLNAETQAVLEQVRAARAELRKAEARLRKGGQDRTALLEAEKAVNHIAQFVAIGGKLRRAAEGVSNEAKGKKKTAVDWDSLRVGAPVLLTTLGARGSVESKPKRGEVTVAVGAMRTTVRLADIELLGSAALAPQAGGARRSGRHSGTPARAAPPVSESAPGAAPMAPGPAASRTDGNTCNLRGQRVDDALAMLDAFVDRLMLQGEPAGFVLHGHGTGALKAAVRHHLGRHPSVARARAADPEDGGDAFTVLWIG